MPEYYSTEEVTKDKFLFISYCHEDKPLVEQCARYLLDEGVRLWYDRALTATNEWPTIVEELLRHPNCNGVFLFSSAAALTSKNVARERKIALEERTKRNVENYPVFFVVVTKDKSLSYIQLIKQAFDSADLDKIDTAFPLESLSVLMQLIGNDSIYRMSHTPDFEKQLFQDIRESAQQTINKSIVFREQMQAHAGSPKDITVNLGIQTADGGSKPITWRFLREENGIASLLCTEVLTESLGGAEAEAWLAGPLFRQAFTPEEQALLSEKPRLLTLEEAKTLDRELLTAGQPWWLGDTRGNLQAIIREDGTVYRNGYNNKVFAKGIRPVISASMEKLSTLVLQE